LHFKTTSKYSGNPHQETQWHKATQHHEEENAHLREEAAVVVVAAVVATVVPEPDQEVAMVAMPKVMTVLKTT
jgi:hypothetical protein